MSTSARHAVHNGPTTKLTNPLAGPVAQLAAWRDAADRAEARADRAVAVAWLTAGLAVIAVGVWAAVRLFLT